MKKHRVYASAVWSLALAFVCLAQGEASKQSTLNRQPAPPGGIRGKLIGTWKLESYERRAESGEVTYPLGRDATGYIMYDDTGHMSVHLMRAGRQRPESRDVLAGGYVAYFGAYEVNEKDGVVIHHIEGSADPGFVGRDFIRYYDFEGEKLTLTVTNKVDGKLPPKSLNSPHLTWRRVK